jgi:hypothetical protein
VSSFGDETCGQMRPSLPIVRSFLLTLCKERTEGEIQCSVCVRVEMGYLFWSVKTITFHFNVKIDSIAVSDNLRFFRGRQFTIGFTDVLNVHHSRILIMSCKPE